MTPPNIRDAVKGAEMVAPQGKVKIEPANLHTYLWPKIAGAKSDGQFEVLVDSKDWMKPDPYAAYPGQVCTEKGLTQIPERTSIARTSKAARATVPPRTGKRDRG